MKPHTIEILMNLIIEEIKGELKNLVVHANLSNGCNAEDLRDAATSCRNIIDVAEALENVLLTAAEELDRLESEILNGEQSDEPTGILGDSATKAAEALAKSHKNGTSGFSLAGYIAKIGRIGPCSLEKMTQEEHKEAHTWPK